MIRCIAIDDEPKALEVIQLFAEKVPFIEIKEYFRNPFDALSYLKDNEVDLLLLDINMPDLNGIEFLDSLEKIPHVIFTTAYSEYAVQSYDYKAVDYLLKPYTLARFIKAINRVNEMYNNPTEPSNKAIENDFIEIKTDNGILQIKLDEIYYIEGAQNYFFIHTANKKHMVLGRLKDIETKLPETRFCRVHKSFIIALDKIEKRFNNHLIVKNTNIPIGKVFKALFLSRVSS